MQRRQSWGDVDGTFRSRGDVGLSLHWCTTTVQGSHRSGFDEAGVMLTVLSGAGVMLGSDFIGAPELVRQATEVDSTRLG